ncbi:MAG: hypothetical protein ABI076_09610, partial [Acidobacteriaceae bacterium]
LLLLPNDKRIVAVARGFGGRVVMTNPAHASGTDRAAEVASSSDADIVVNVQGDEPLLEPEMINECVRALQDALLHKDGVEFSTVIKRAGEGIYNDQDVVKVVRDLRVERYIFRGP